LRRKAWAVASLRYVVARSYSYVLACIVALTGKVPRAFPRVILFFKLKTLL
jgi:hypothetical protein